MLNERQDYFGQTVNIASRVQHLAMSQAIFASGSVVTDPSGAAILTNSGVAPIQHQAALRGSPTSSRCMNSHFAPGSVASRHEMPPPRSSEAFRVGQGYWWYRQEPAAMQTLPQVDRVVPRDMFR